MRRALSLLIVLFAVSTAWAQNYCPADKVTILTASQADCTRNCSISVAIGQPISLGAMQSAVAGAVSPGSHCIDTPYDGPGYWSDVSTVYSSGGTVVTVSSTCKIGNGNAFGSAYVQAQVTCADPPPNRCANNDSNEYAVPAGYNGTEGQTECLDSCLVVYHSTLGLTVSSDPTKSGVTGGEWFSGTTQQCPNGALNSVDNNKLPNPAKQNQTCKQVPIYDLNGQQETTIPICSSTDPSKQGQLKVDGTDHDYSKPPSNVCLTTADGKQVCDTYPSPPGQDQHQPTPPVPNQGPDNPATSGDESKLPADPSGCITVSNSATSTSTRTCEYSAATVSQSTTAGGGSGGHTTGGQTTGGTTSGGTCDPSKQTCGTGSVSGGTDCDAPPVCDGDPVACYQAKVQWQTVCAYAPDKQAAQHFDAGATGSANGTITKGSLIPQLPGPDYSTYNGYFAGNVGAAGCLSDTHWSFSIGDHAFDIPIPLSSICPVLQIVRLIVLVGCALASVKIFAAGVA